ncbi:MAG: hypothetical protein GY784_04140 [Gammaproteobacteria bacterium]|nr:hypothetical protein [Gammaproteobacteria bacterium]
MDASSLRWVLTIIGVILLVGIYLYGVQQSRLRKRAARDTFTRDEVDSAFIEDEQLRQELDDLDTIISDDGNPTELEPIHINPALEANIKPVVQTVDLYVADVVSAIDTDNLVSHLLMHADQRLITGEELFSACQHSGLAINAEGLLEYDGEELCMRFSSLSEPGHFSDFDKLTFTTLGLNCFFDSEACAGPDAEYETMLEKVDELVRLLNVKVYQSNRQLLTISDVAELRKKLSA